MGAVELLIRPMAPKLRWRRGTRARHGCTYTATIARRARRSESRTPRRRRQLSSISNSRLKDRTNPRRLLSNDPGPEFDPAPQRAAIRNSARPGPGARVRSDDACISRIRPDAIRNLRGAIRRARPQDTRWRRRDRNQRMPRPARRRSSNDAAALSRIPRRPSCSIRLPLLIFTYR